MLPFTTILHLAVLQAETSDLRCKLVTGKAHHGHCVSKRSWFYKLKV